MAMKIYNLGFKSLEELKKADPVKMVNEYQQQVNCHVDPCVEDVFRCAITQCKYKEISTEKKHWWYWVGHRGQHDVNL
jgi:hypothetical protein